MGLSIRRATPADVDVVARFNAALAWESEHKRLDEETLRLGVRAVLADAHKGFYTLAERDGGDVVGQVLVTYEWSDWRNGWYWWIQSVYVHANGRRGGVFRALFDHLKAAATADPTVIGLRLYVDRDNAAAQATYRAIGMEEEPYHLLGMYPLPGKANVVAGG
ncbi:GNAT family N-acetyltransferase [Fimbriiglobus ruber]|uniref:Protein export cytoplasm protein SecA ATPase RNA helicase n=1 Tax=Fimbriiglobus ruber TaxID=1908690 RepID=A0A225E6C7_9BACT|nr:GNAT family N-acetyltransferase [Fimbriiglobus ruber]OWK45049.1 Protein export cytoplasm protein SecA ATPase RNA helicase [Fimbriiglobus ruber]